MFFNVMYLKSKNYLILVNSQQQKVQIFYLLTETKYQVTVTDDLLLLFITVTLLQLLMIYYSY